MKASRPPGIQLDPHDAAAPPGGQEARGTAQAGAHVEHAGGRLDAGAPGKEVDGGETPIVVLVEIEEIVGGEAAQVAAPSTPDGVQHLPLVDGMAIVEGNSVDSGAMIKAIRPSSNRLRGNP